MRLTSALFVALSLACAGAVELRAKDPTPVAISDQALALRGTDHRGQAFDLQEVIAERPTVVIFYRGHW